MNILVVGAGNEIAGDDAVGIHVVKELKKFPLPKNIKTILIGTNCWLLTKEAKVYEQIVVIDAISTRGKEGEVYYIPAKELCLEERPYTLHDITWLDVLRMLGLLERSYIFGIEINTLNIGEGLSLILKGRINIYAAKLYKILTTDEQNIGFQ